MKYIILATLLTIAYVSGIVVGHATAPVIAPTPCKTALPDSARAAIRAAKLEAAAKAEEVVYYQNLAKQFEK